MKGHQLGKRVVPVVCGLAVLAGCAARPRIAPLDASHPAHAAAPEGVVREPSALAADTTLWTPAPAPLRGRHHRHHHQRGGAGHAH